MKLWPISRIVAVVKFTFYFIATASSTKCSNVPLLKLFTMNRDLASVECLFFAKKEGEKGHGSHIIVN